MQVAAATVVRCSNWILSLPRTILPRSTHAVKNTSTASGERFLDPPANIQMKTRTLSRRSTTV